MKQRFHAFISGRVQGVSFRANTRNVATNLDIKGWVRNLRDGRVEVMAEGNKDKINDFIEFLKTGQDAAMIYKVDVRMEGYKGEFKDFTIKF